MGENSITNLNTWNEVTSGLFRYVIAANACYEIHLEYYDVDTPIGTAKASLYIVGEWKSSESKTSYFSRESLIKHSTVQECLETAAKDNEENNQLIEYEEDFKLNARN